MKALFSMLLLLVGAGSALRAAPETAAPSEPAKRTPFRLVFKSYDGDPNQDPKSKFSFQIDTVDLRQPSEFVRLGEHLTNTPFKLLDFAYKTRLNPKTGESDDVSELILVNTKTRKTVVLIIGKATDVSAVYSPPPAPVK